MEVLNGKIGYTRTTVTGTVTSTCSSDYEVGTRQEETVDLVTIGDTIIYKYLRCYVGHNVRVSYIISNSPIQDLSEEELVMLDIQKQIGTIEASNIEIELSGYSTITVCDITVSGTDIRVGGHYIGRELESFINKYCRMEVEIIDSNYGY